MVPESHLRDTSSAFLRRLGPPPLRRPCPSPVGVPAGWEARLGLWVWGGGRTGALLSPEPGGGV